MGWNSANLIFDPVAEILLKSTAQPQEITNILVCLIKELQAGDWDTENESLEDFAHEPSVVEAFRICGVEPELDED